MEIWQNLKKNARQIMILLPHYVLAENKNTNLENGNILHIWALYRHSTVSTSAVSFGGCNILQKKTFVPRADFFC